MRAIQNDHPRARIDRLLNAVPIDSEIRISKRNVVCPPTIQPHAWLISIIGRVKYNDFITWMDHSRDGAEYGFCCSRRDHNFTFRIGFATVEIQCFCGYLLTQLGYTSQWRVLVAVMRNVPGDPLTQRHWAVKIGKPLGEVDGTVVTGHF